MALGILPNIGNTVFVATYDELKKSSPHPEEEWGYIVLDRGGTDFRRKEEIYT